VPDPLFAGAVSLPLAVGADAIVLVPPECCPPVELDPVAFACCFNTTAESGARVASAGETASCRTNAPTPTATANGSSAIAGARRRKLGRMFRRLATVATSAPQAWEGAESGVKPV
jgi:hypothetical protein